MNCKSLFIALKALPPEIATLSHDAPFLKVQVGQCEIQVPTVDSSEFPLIEKMDVGKSLELPVEQIREGLARCINQTTPERSRYSLNGVYVHTVGPYLSFVATNARSLSHVTFERENLDGGFEVIIPSETVKIWLKLLPKPRKGAKPENVTLSLSEDSRQVGLSGFGFHSIATTLYTEVGEKKGDDPSIQFAFPPYAGTLEPFQSFTGNLCNSTELITAINSVGKSVERKDNGVHLTYHGEGSLEVSKSDYDGHVMGRACVSFPRRRGSYPTPTFRILLAQQYLLDTLRSLPKNTQIELGRFGESGPLTFRCSPPDSQFLVMLLGEGRA